MMHGDLAQQEVLVSYLKIFLIAASRKRFSNSQKALKYPHQSILSPTFFKT